MKILESLIPIILKLIGAFVANKKSGDESEERFLALVETMESEGMKSVKLRQSYRDQIEERKKMRRVYQLTKEENKKILEEDKKND